MHRHVDADIAAVIFSDYLGEREALIPHKRNKQVRRRIHVFSDPDHVYEMINAAAYAKRNQIKISMVYAALRMYGVVIQPHASPVMTGERVGEHATYEYNELGIDCSGNTEEI